MHAFMESLLDCPVSDGYGSTESGGGIMRNGKIMRPPVTDYSSSTFPSWGTSPPTSRIRAANCI
jgi:fatty acid CoA ligase FadD9